MLGVELEVPARLATGEGRFVQFRRSVWNILGTGKEKKNGTKDEKQGQP